VAIPEADVQWFHNKVELKESKRVSIQHQSDMHMYCSIIKITDIKKEDAGTYEVTARNRYRKKLILKFTTTNVTLFILTFQRSSEPLF
jgi:hypothetical protein